jgi:hypothetical protein
MRRRLFSLVLLASLAAAAPTPCVSAQAKLLPPLDGANEKNDANGEKKKNGAPRPTTLLEWTRITDDKKEEDEEDKPKRLPHDRPHFADDPTTVGLGRIMLESGYTYTRDRFGPARLDIHTFPESLLRLGVVAEWLEVRLRWNYVIERLSSPVGAMSWSGADDMAAAVRLALTEQQGWLPETAVTLEFRLPTGARVFTSNEVQPTLFYHYGWEAVKDFLTVECMSVAGRQLDDNGHGYLQLAQAVNLEYKLTRNLDAFSEWFAFFPFSATSPGFVPQYYLQGGFSYYITDNFEVDWRIGFGLNRHSDDFFTGAGLAVRY